MGNILIWQLAFRYLRGKRMANAVPILSRISMVAIAVSSGAMIIIFSVFNGLESVVKDLYKAFYPDLKISAARGKFFHLDAEQLHRVKQVNGIGMLTPVIEDNVFANNHEQQKVIMLKGVENSYFDVTDVKQYIREGDDTVSIGNPNTAVVGQRIINELGADVNTLSYIMLYYPNPTVTNPSADMMSAFQSLKLHPAGVFRIQDEFDSKYVLAPLSLVQELFHQPGQYSSIEIKVNGENVKSVKQKLQQLLGPAFRVESRYEQNKTIYMVMTGEKWAVYAILLLVLLIASFNMVGALSMLVLEKQKDIAILKAMGALPGTIRKIFFLEGMFWSLIGGIGGIVPGIIICLLQQKFGFVKLGGGSFLMDAYPVKIEVQDLFLVIVTLLGVGFLTSWFPALRATKTADPTLKSA